MVSHIRMLYLTETQRVREQDMEDMDIGYQIVVSQLG